MRAGLDSVFCLKSLLLGAFLQAVCALIVRTRYLLANGYRTDPSARSLWLGIPLLHLLEQRLQHLPLATKLGATWSLRSQYFRCLFSALRGVLLHGCTWESRFLFECGPSRLPSAAQQVWVMFLDLKVIAHTYLFKTGSGTSCFRSFLPGLLIGESELQSKLLGMWLNVAP